MTEIIAVIDAPHFYCGIVLVDDKVTEAAPIVGYMAKQGWSRDRVRTYCQSKGWKVAVIASIEEKPRKTPKKTA